MRPATWRTIERVRVLVLALVAASCRDPSDEVAAPSPTPRPASSHLPASPTGTPTPPVVAPPQPAPQRPPPAWPATLLGTPCSSAPQEPAAGPPAGPARDARGVRLQCSGGLVVAVSVSRPLPFPDHAERLGRRSRAATVYSFAIEGDRLWIHAAFCPSCEVQRPASTFVASLTALPDEQLIDLQRAARLDASAPLRTADGWRAAFAR